MPGPPCCQQMPVCIREQENRLRAIHVRSRQLALLCAFSSAGDTCTYVIHGVVADEQGCCRSFMVASVVKSLVGCMCMAGQEFQIYNCVRANYRSNMQTLTSIEARTKASDPVPANMRGENNCVNFVSNSLGSLLSAPGSTTHFAHQICRLLSSARLGPFRRNRSRPAM